MTATPPDVLRLAFMDPEERARFFEGVSGPELRRYDGAFANWSHHGQHQPLGDWTTWLMIAGRGYGKTRAGAEWVDGLARPRRSSLRIALVAATIAEARAVMVDGVSGLLNVAGGHGCRFDVTAERVVWPSGAQAFLYSGENPEKLRGPEHHYAWCDELAKWAKPDATWDMLRMGLRLGERPRALVTTTPRPVPILKRLQETPGTVETGGPMAANINLADTWKADMVASYGGTMMGRQELDGELIQDVQGALWPREVIEACRVREVPDVARVVIGVDPPAGSGPASDACGIVVVALGADGRGYVLADASVREQRPEQWAEVVAAAARRFGADRVVAEKNQGGEMVGAVLRAAEAALPLTLVHASRGKVARAEPVATLYAQGRVAHAGAFPELEDEMAGLTAGGGYQGPGGSPDRADALVWALSELMLGERRVEPGVKLL